jgi:hypothetical protein
MASDGVRPAAAAGLAHVTFEERMLCDLAHKVKISGMAHKRMPCHGTGRCRRWVMPGQGQGRSTTAYRNGRVDYAPVLSRCQALIWVFVGVVLGPMAPSGALRQALPYYVSRENTPPLSQNAQGPCPFSILFGSLAALQFRMGPGLSFVLGPRTPPPLCQFYVGPCYASYDA